MSRPSFVLIGPPGVGKSTVGKLLAEKLDLPFEDSDEIVADSFGESIMEIFATHGEVEFRQVEAEVISDLLRDTPGVISLGGGAVMNRATQINLEKYVRAGGQVIFLDVTADAVAARLLDGGRPLLAEDDRLAKWVRLYGSRKPTYLATSTKQIDTSKLSAIQVINQILNRENDGFIKVKVPVAEPYEVFIGCSILDNIPSKLSPGSKALIIYPEPLGYLTQDVIDILESNRIEVVTHAVPDAEAQKTAEVLVQCWEAAALAGITRTDAVVTVGGGATTDLGGFVAATWLRGIKVIHIPTSLLAMVDAAVGGKTGINTPQGKNLVGSFYQSDAVICDLEMLRSLPSRDFAAGLAEVIKCGFIADPVILDLVKRYGEQLIPWQGDTTKELWAVISELIRRAVQVKANIAGDDPKEKGAREFLNYGHTLGHAIELAEDFKWRHGEAISVGMVFAAELANLAGLLSADAVALHRELLSCIGLPITYQNATLEELLPAMQRDKKTRGAQLRFIVLNQIAEPTRLAGPSPKLLQQAFNRII